MCYFNYKTYKHLQRFFFVVKLIIPLSIIAVVVLYAFLPQSYQYKKPELMKIARGNSLKEITFKLYDKNLIKNPYLFYFIGFITGYSRYIETGTYYVSIDESPASIYRKFVNGRVATAKIVIPPGLSIFRIAEILAKNKITSERQFLAECFDQKFLLSIKIDKKSVEGFLYPDTYMFKVDSNPKNIIEEMVNEFDLKTKNLKLTYNNLVIASMIIKEANGNYKDGMKLISSVIHNRLRINMPLDIDSTSIYARNLLVYKKYLPMMYKSRYKFKFAMNPAYLKSKSPYNTYLNYGLPLTPIANPNIVAIKAAIHPAKTRYFYYIATKSGRTIFAQTLREQNKNISKYLK